MRVIIDETCKHAVLQTHILRICIKLLFTNVNSRKQRAIVKQK